MTPEQRIKRQILISADLHAKDGIRIDITADNVDDLFEEAEGKDGYYLQDPTSEFRCSGEPTGLECEWSRHYESTAVGRQLDDGAWVGWTYWFGGGKHSEPEAIDWMNEAYDLDVTSEQKLVTVHTFTKKEPA